MLIWRNVRIAEKICTSPLKSMVWQDGSSSFRYSNIFNAYDASGIRSAWILVFIRSRLKGINTAFMKISNCFTYAVVTLIIILQAPMASGQQKIAYINTSELLQQMPEVQAAEKSMQEFQKQKQTMLEGMDAERRRKVALYEEKYKTLSVANRETVERELQTMEEEITGIERRLQETQEQAQEEAGAKQEALLAPILQKAMNAIAIVARERQFSYVLDTAQPDVIYFDGGEDLLVPVKERLDPKSQPAQQ